ncbi:MAG: efflux RND transporter permease subunit [Planctomycetota bacterium]|nr:efflux RND transporter permease subunit [Planctomycetota bacterium]
MVQSHPLAFVTRRPVAITMFMLAMVVFGSVSLSKLHVDLLPEISYPTLTVRTSWPGAAPEDVEERISEKVQEALSTLDDLVRSTSISRAGVSDVVLDFDWGTQMTFAVQDVREKLDAVFLPRGVERPLILRYDPNLDPILRVGVRVHESLTKRTAEEQLIHLRWVAENRIKRDLESIEGVAAVQVRGGLEEEIRVRTDPHKLAALKIDPGELARRLAQENINASGGSLLEGSTEYLVRTLNEFVSVDEISELPIARRGRAVIRVRDVAKVERTYAKREVISRIGGGEAVEVAVYREADANIVALSTKVKDRIFGTDEQQQFTSELREKGLDVGAASFGDRNKTEFLAWRLRKDVQLELLSDQSTFIRDAIDDVRNAALFGAVLAVGVILLFLRRLSATLIIGLSIPISIIVTFAPMFMAGISLNIMSLGGLALGVGMLVDNAIVVLESITRCREEGDDFKHAAVRGVSEVSGAVIASTLTTIAVFAPIVFVTGIAGQIFGDQAMTVVTALLVSLVVAILFIPMLASRRFHAAGQALGAPDGKRRQGLRDERMEPAQGAAGLVGDDDAVEKKPPGLLSGMSWNYTTLFPNLLLLLGRVVMLVLGTVVRLTSAGLFLLYKLGAIVTKPAAWAFNVGWGALERGYPPVVRSAVGHPLVVFAIAGALFYVAMQRVPRLGVELLPEIHQGEFTAFVKLEVGSPLLNTDQVLRKIDERVRAIEGVRTTALTVGVEKDTLTREIEGPHTARLLVRLTDEASTPETEMRISEEVRRIIAADPAVGSVELERPTPFALESPIAVEIRGYDLEVLEEVAREVELLMREMEVLTDIRTTLRPGHLEALVTFDREKTLEFGLDLSEVSNLVRDMVLGNVSTRFNDGEERIDVRVIGDEVILSTLQDILDLPVNPSATALSGTGVADVRMVQGPAEIRRIKNSRAIVVSAVGTDLDLGGIADAVEAQLAPLRIPDDVTVELGGQKREMDEAQRSMRFALLLAVFLVYVVMASQFESLVQPLIILLTVPLAAVGVVLVLDLLDIPLSVVVFIGLIMLAGIVVNNAIVLVDRINQMRDRGLDVLEAVEEASRARLRPILMTTATTALGLLPLTGWLAGIPVVGQLGSGEGTELRAPMAIAVITGLITSTLLTLLVIPTAYALMCRLGLSPRGNTANG